MTGTLPTRPGPGPCAVHLLRTKSKQLTKVVAYGVAWDVLEQHGYKSCAAAGGEHQNLTKKEEYWTDFHSMLEAQPDCNPKYYQDQSLKTLNHLLALPRAGK